MIDVHRAIIVVVRIEHDRLPDLVEVREIGGLLGGSFSLCEYRK
jgi:hypothetical protein